MEKYLLLFLGISLMALSSTAQDCAKELLAQKPGTWKAGQQGSVNNVSAADLVKEKAVMAAIHKMKRKENPATREALKKNAPNFL